MAMWVTRRLLQAVLVMLAMTIVVFLGVNVIGDPVSILISPDADQATRMHIIAQLGLNQPLWRQYLHFVDGIVHLHFASSYVYNAPALTVVLQRLPATLELAFGALLTSLVIGVPLGLWAGLRPKSLSSRTVMGFSILGFSLPTFWIGLMLIMVFSVDLGWLPVGGRGQTVELLGVQWSFLTLDGLRHLILPTLTQSLFYTSLIMRLIRDGASDALRQDYVKFARAKGLSWNRIIGVHVLKNILIPVVTIVGLEFGSLIAFSVVTETIFAWPGIGKLIIDSINALDRPIIVAYLMVIVVIFVSINLIVDLLYMFLDPRARLSSLDGM